MKITYAYDLETFPNFFSAVFINIDDESMVYEFVLHETRNDLLELMAFISQPNLRLVGYNQLHYDNTMLNALLEWKDKLLKLANKLINKKLYNLSKTIIETDKKEYPRWLKTLQYQDAPFESVDLMELVSVNMTRPSLKHCGIHLKRPLIQDLPFPPHKKVKPEQHKIILDYNVKDVKDTISLYHSIYGDIEVRDDLSMTYGVTLSSAGDNKIAKTIFSEKYGVPEITKTVHTKLTIKDLLPKKFIFKTETLIKFIDTISQKSIVPVVKISKQDVNKFKNTFSHNGQYYVVKKVDKAALEEIVTIGDNSYLFSAGGLHSIDAPGIFKTDENFIIRDADVTSFYPYIILNEGLKPGHLTDFYYTVYRWLVEERVLAKDIKDYIKAAGLKLAINGAFGLMNFPYFWLYDPKPFFSVTISGEMYLLDFVEKLELAGIEVISANTDGVTVRMPREKEHIYKEVCQEWQERTSFKLDYVDYDVYARRDVNNYMTVSNKGEVKTKGCFSDLLGNMKDGKYIVPKFNFVKAYTYPVVALSLQAYFKDGTLPDDFIKSHEDVYDFMVSERVGKQFKLYARSMVNGRKHDEPLQKTNRWIVSKTGVRLVKVKVKNDKKEYGMLGEMKSKESSVLSLFKGVDITICNDVQDEKESYGKINHQWYIDQAWEIVSKIEGYDRRKPQQRGLFG